LQDEQKRMDEDLRELKANRVRLETNKAELEGKIGNLDKQKEQLKRQSEKLDSELQMTERTYTDNQRKIENFKQDLTKLQSSLNALSR